MRLRFTIRDLLWLALVVALGLDLKGHCAEVESKANVIAMEIGRVRTFSDAVSFDIKLKNNSERPMRVSSFSMYPLLYRVTFHSDSSSWKVKRPPGPAPRQAPPRADYVIKLDPNATVDVRVNLSRGSGLEEDSDRVGDIPKAMKYAVEWLIETANENFEPTGPVDIVSNGQCEVVSSQEKISDSSFFWKVELLDDKKENSK